MRSIFCFLILLASGLATGQNIPPGLVGKWVIERELPTKTISCWGEEDAKAIIGSEIEYTPDSFRWKVTVVKHPTVELRVISAEQFERENSSPSVHGSQVSFRQLGINARNVQQVGINHPPAEITKATTEIPGDEVLLKNENTLVFSVCNLYFEAGRVGRSDTQMLSVSIRSPKSSYGIQEKLSLEIQFENVGNESLLLWRSWAWGVGRTDVRVIDSNGKDIMTAFLADQLPPMPRKEDFIELRPTEFFGIRLTEDAMHFVNTPGTYDFVVEHTVPLTEQYIRKYVTLPHLPLWGRERGTITSNKIRIEILK